MIEMELVSSNYLLLLVPCGCSGEPWCECYEDSSGRRVKVVGELDLSALLHNLAVAGALTRAFRLGDNAGWQMAENERGDDWYDDDDRQHTHVPREPWRPNAEGRAA